MHNAAFATQSTSGTALFAAQLRFDTPPRRQQPFSSAEVELTVLTAGMPIAHHKWPRQTLTSGSAYCTPAKLSLDTVLLEDGSRCTSAGSFTTTALPSNEISPPYHGAGVACRSATTGHSDSPCGLSSGRLTMNFSDEPPATHLYIPSRSSVSTPAPLLGVTAGRGVSDVLPVTPNAVHDEEAAVNSGSFFVSNSAERLVGMRSARSSTNDVQSPCTPSFTNFPRGTRSSRKDSVHISRDRTVMPRSLGVVLPCGVRAGRESVSQSSLHASAMEHKMFEPLRLDQPRRPTSPRQPSATTPFLRPISRASEGEHHNGSMSEVRHDDRTFSSIQTPERELKSTLTCTLEQQRLLHACLVTMAREREEARTHEEHAQRSNNARLTRLIGAVARLLFAVVWRLPSSMIMQLLTVSSRRVKLSLL